MLELQNELFGESDPNVPFRVAVCGGRDFFHEGYLYSALDEVVRERPRVIVATGDAKGADLLARQWAAARKHALTAPYVANWKRDGKAAGPRRNGALLDDFKPDVVVAFFGGRGTKDMIRQARARKVPVVIAGGSEEDLVSFERNLRKRKTKQVKKDLPEGSASPTNGGVS